jgi:hypothetical protein
MVETHLKTHKYDFVAFIDGVHQIILKLFLTYCYTILKLFLNYSKSAFSRFFPTWSFFLFMVSEAFSVALVTVLSLKYCFFKDLILL